MTRGKTSFTVETDYDNWNRRGSGGTRNYGKLQVEYHLTVPRNAVLNEIAAVNGSISVTGATNVTKASAVNGEVRATNLRGTANLSTVNGKVVADFDQLQAGGKISLETVNGTVDLMIPSDANATIKADTVNGKISNDFGLPIRKGEYVGSNLYGKLGSGDARIHLNSVNGALSVRRKNDGKNLVPAVNLLNIKTEEDWDIEDGEDNSNIRSPKPPKAPKSPNAPNAPNAPNIPLPPAFSGNYNEAIRKTVEDAMEKAEREMEQMGPEFEESYKEALRQARKYNSAEMQARLKELEFRYKDALAQSAANELFYGRLARHRKKKRFVCR